MDDTLAQLGTEPVNADAPTGVSVRYEPEFEQLQEEIAKLESVDAVPVNWNEVVDIGSRLLSEKSKDLLVACYVCHGLYDRHGYAGLANGLAILSGMINTYWDTLFPEQKRQRARVAAMEWLVERLGTQVPEHKPKPAERDAVAAAKTLLEQLDEVLKEKLGEQTVAWGELYRPLREYHADFEREAARQQQAKEAEQKKAESAATASTATPTAEAGSAAPVQASAPQEITSEQDINKSLRSCQEILKKVANYQREKNLADPDPYRFLRMATWMNAGLPPAQNNVTQMRQVSAERLEFLKQQVDSGNHVLLINEVESSFANAPFWLDAHRLTVMALEALGHVDARQAVIIELAAFLRRFPKLLDYQFMGGEPFADDLTRLWIESDVLAGGETSSAGTPGDAGNSPWQEVSTEARQLATKGKFREGVMLFQTGRRQAGSRRERFMWDLQQARFCQEAGHVEVAIPQLEALDGEAEYFHLEEWEPALSLQIAALLLVCYTKAEGKAELSADRAARLERMQSRVSRLDAATALDLMTKAK
jgi:type VI secretion system protein VasJ